MSDATRVQVIALLSPLLLVVLGIVGMVWSVVGDGGMIAPTVVHSSKERIVATIPFRMDHNLVVVKASLGDGVVMDLVFDTGAGGNHYLFDASTPAISLEDFQDTAFWERSDGSMHAVPAAYNQTLVLMGESEPVVQMEGQVFLKVPSWLPGFAEVGQAVQGIIGGDALTSRFVVAVDYVRGQVRLHDFESFESPLSGCTAPLSVLGGDLPHIEATIQVPGGTYRSVKLMLDTGAEVELSLRIPPGSVALRSAPRRTDLGSGLRGEVTGRTAQIAALRIGGCTWTNVTTQFPDSGSGHESHWADGKIGGAFLKSFEQVFLNTDNGRVDFVGWRPSGSTVVGLPQPAHW